MTTTNTLSTPLLDAFLQTKPRFDRFVNAKADLIEGVANKHIWNVVFTGAKDNISRGVDEVVRAKWEATLDEYHTVREMSVATTKDYDYQQKYFAAHELLGLSCQLNHAPGKVKRLAKLTEVSFVPDFLAVLKEVAQLNDLVNSAKPFIVKGRKPSENPVEIDYTNTATCSICSKIQKLTAGLKMVHHGFQISNGRGYFGCRVGSCFGVGYAPYEISNEGNIAYREVLKLSLEGQKSYLGKLNAGEVTTFTDAVQQYNKKTFRSEIVHVTITKGEKGFADRLRKEVRTVEGHIDNIKYGIELQTERIDKWTRKPTYDERQEKKAKA